MISLIVITDIQHDFRFEYLKRTMESARENLNGLISERIMHEDSGNPNNLDKLRRLYPDFEHIGGVQRRGYGGAIIACWERLKTSTTDYVFHLEDDFTFPAPVPLAEMAELLQVQPHLAQLALRRQPWGHEIPHGGFMEMAPSWYTQRVEGSHSWIETTRNWTSNPSLYRRQIVEVGWPNAPYSEGVFGFKLREQTGLPWGIKPEDVRFGFYGKANNCTHIGTIRAGTGY